MLPPETQRKGRTRVQGGGCDREGTTLTTGRTPASRPAGKGEERLLTKAGRKRKVQKLGPSYDGEEKGRTREGGDEQKQTQTTRLERSSVGERSETPAQTEREAAFD